MKQLLFTLFLLLTASIISAHQATPAANDPALEALEQALPVALPKQLSKLDLAKQVSLDAGFKQPEVVQSILLQESHAGTAKVYKVINPGPAASFGLMQLQLGTAKDVLARNRHLYAKYGFHTQTDDEIKANLILNEAFNLEVATKYLMLLQKRHGFTGVALLNAYNRGPGGTDLRSRSDYVTSASTKLASWKERHK